MDDDQKEIPFAYGWPKIYFCPNCAEGYRAAVANNEPYFVFEMDAAEGPDPNVCARCGTNLDEQGE